MECRENIILLYSQVWGKGAEDILITYIIKNNTKYKKMHTHKNYNSTNYHYCSIIIVCMCVCIHIYINLEVSIW